MFEVIINGNKEITRSMGLRKRSEDGPIRSVGMSESTELQDLIGRLKMVLMMNKRMIVAWQEYTKYKVGNKVKIDTDNKKKQ